MPKFKYQISVGEKSWKKKFPEYKKAIEKCLDAITASSALQSKPEGFRDINKDSKGAQDLLLKLGDDVELSILLANNDRIHELNRTYRGIDKPTNVLSFRQEESELLGDVVMGLETLEREAAEQNKTFHDHFCHLFIHGVLHLLGYDHNNDKEQKEMEGLEKEILDKLNIGDPYL